jgi:hypothetical protein
MPSWSFYFVIMNPRVEHPPTPSFPSKYYICNRGMTMTYDLAKYNLSSVVVWCTLLRKLTIRHSRPLLWRNFAPIPLNFTLHSSLAVPYCTAHIHFSTYCICTVYIRFQGRGGGGIRKFVLGIRIRWCLVILGYESGFGRPKLIKDPDPTWTFCGHWKRKLIN